MLSRNMTLCLCVRLSVRHTPAGADPDIGFSEPPPVSVSRCQRRRAASRARGRRRRGVGMGDAAKPRPKLNFVKYECQRKPSGGTYLIVWGIWLFAPLDPPLHASVPVKGWMDRVGFWHRNYPWLTLHCNSINRVLPSATLSGTLNLADFYLANAARIHWSLVCLSLEVCYSRRRCSVRRHYAYAYNAY